MDAKHECNASGGQGPAESGLDYLDDFNLWLIFKLTPDFPDPDHLWDELVDYWSHVEAEAPPARRFRLARRIADLWTKRRDGAPRADLGHRTSHAEWSALSASVLGTPLQSEVMQAAPGMPESPEAKRAEAALDLAAGALERFLGMACRVRDFGRSLSRRAPGAATRAGGAPARPPQRAHLPASPTRRKGLVIARRPRRWRFRAWRTSKPAAIRP
jgi:hypothetical protein